MARSAEKRAKDLVHDGSFDHARRRKSLRAGRERGCWVYIPAPMLRTAGIGLDQPPPEYRVWAGPRGGVVVSLYRREE